MPTTKSRVIIRRIIVLSFLLFLGLATPHDLQWTQAKSDATNDGLPTLRGEAALTRLKERGLYSSLGEAVKAARYNAQPLPPDIAPLLAGSLRLEAADGAAEDYFGAAVAISGNTAIVGAPRNDINGDADQGAAYIFVRSGGTWTQEDKLKAPTGAAGDFFGGSVAISGDTAIVGAYLNDIDGIDFANQGSVYIFTRSAGVWTQQDKLTASDGAANDLFGFSVAIEGDTAIIGAHLADVGVNVNQGAAYVFTRSGGVWSELQKLTAPDGAAGDLFGMSVALDAETAVIGAGGKLVRGDADAGAAYVFTLSGGMWVGIQILLPDIRGAGDFFGAAVALSGDTVLIGSWGDDIGANTNQGSAVVFARSGGMWSQQQKLTAADGADGDNFGLSVALSGDTAVIGATGDDINGADQGSAYIFSRSGATWSQQPRLLDTLGGKDDKFGVPVAISGDTVLIGASFDDIDGNANQGSASVFVIRQGLAEQQKLTAAYGAANDYFGDPVAICGDTVVVGASNNEIGGNYAQGSVNVFVRGGATWTHQQRLTADDGAAWDTFGASVAISGDTVIVGAVWASPGGNFEQGAAYVFTRNGATWTQQQKLTASDGAAGDYFGVVAVSGDTAVIGAPGQDIGGNLYQGAAYVFTRSGATWTQQQKLTASDGAAYEYFGSSVAISGDTVLIGAAWDDIGGNADQGSAYVFTRSGATWTQQEKLTASDGAAGDYFGVVAISGDTVLIGAPFDDTGGNTGQGSAYVFERSGATWTQQQRLTASDGASNDRFGISVAISGDTVVVGAGGSQEAAYVFERGGETWTERQILTASDGAAYDDFASSVAISGDTVVVGAHLADVGANEEQGAAYVFAGVACPAITLDPPSLPDGTAGSPYNWSITATGGSGLYNYSVSSGTLPVGLTLNPATGLLSGRPVMAGSYDFTITATDGSLCPGHRDYRLVIDCPAITVRPVNPNLSPGQVGAPYAQTFTASGGLAPYSFSVSAGALPTGLTLDPATGVLSGTPAASGTFNFAIQATDSGGCSGMTAYVLTISCPTIQINPANPNLPNGTAGAPFNGAITVMGGAAPYSFSITNGALPGGLTLDAATGVLSGTPIVTGAFNFAVRVADGFGCFGSRAYVLTINCPTINVEPANSNPPNGAVGVAYNQTFSATGGVGSYTFDVAAGALPSGLVLNTSTGVLSGTPTSRNTFDFVIRATDSNGCIGRRPYRIVVN
jgi:FG-GAP repeat protein/putative Ig domain-containing protein